MRSTSRNLPATSVVKTMLDTPIEDRFERISRLAARLFDAHLVAIALTDGDRHWLKSVYGPASPSGSDASPIISAASRQHGVLVVPDAPSDAAFRDDPLVAEADIVSCAACDIRPDAGAAIGVLLVGHGGPHVWSEEDQTMLADLAGMVESELTCMACSPAQAELIAEAPPERRRTLIDPVTRLWNRAGIVEILGRQLRWGRDTDTPTAIMLVAVDGLDRFGDRGDEVMAELGRCAIGAVRETDAVGRCGDERLLVVCGGPIDRAQMDTIAARLRHRSRTGPYQVGGRSCAIGLSIGMAATEPRAGADVDSMLQTANTALMKVRAAGGDRVSW